MIYQAISDRFGGVKREHIVSAIDSLKSRKQKQVQRMVLPVPLICPGCRNKINQIPCFTCANNANQAADISTASAAKRLNPGERGYNYKWQKESKAFLRLPQNRLCCECKRRGRTAASEIVDHIIPHRGDKKLSGIGTTGKACA